MKNQNQELTIYVISDSIGDTGENVVNAALAQFDVKNVDIKKIPYINSIEDIKVVIDEASQIASSILFYTIVEYDLIEFTKKYSKEKNLTSIDLIGPVIKKMKERTGWQPMEKSGIIRRMDSDYFRRIEAIEFAVKYDDGQDPSGILKADLVILGISRTSKTPLSLFLANKKIKVCNIPLVPESKPPEEIYQIPARKIIGLTNSPMEIIEVRESRLRALGLPKGSSYAKMERILEELEYADRIMKNIGCPIVDMTHKAVEDTGDIILSLLRKYNSKFQSI